MQCDVSYKFRCTAQFGDLSEAVVCELFQDGRHAAGFIERQIEIWFPGLQFKDGRGWDHQDQQGVRYEAKCFTRCGADYSASRFKGVGRKFDLQEHIRLAESLIYIICDITQFPEVQVIFKTGTDLLQTYPRGKIPFRCRDPLFKGDQL